MKFRFQAYVKPQSASVQVAKIVGVTVVLMSVVLGSFILASAYVTANASCRQLEQELEFLSEAADRFQAPPQPEALIQVLTRKIRLISGKCMLMLQIKICGIDVKRFWSDAN